MKKNSYKQMFNELKRNFGKHLEAYGQTVKNSHV